MFHKDAVEVPDVIQPGVVVPHSLFSARKGPRNRRPGLEVGVRVEEEGFVVHETVVLAGLGLQGLHGLRQGHGAVGVQEEASSVRDGCEVGQVLPQRSVRCLFLLSGRLALAAPLPGDAGVRPQDCARGRPARRRQEMETDRWIDGYMDRQTDR